MLQLCMFRASHQPGGLERGAVLRNSSSAEVAKVSMLANHAGWQTMMIPRLCLLHCSTLSLVCY